MPTRQSTPLIGLVSKIRGDNGLPRSTACTRDDINHLGSVTARRKHTNLARRDQVDLALSRSFLQLLLPHDCALHVWVHFVPNQIVDAIADRQPHAYVAKLVQLDCTPTYRVPFFLLARI